jgi:hypothetical protein
LISSGQLDSNVTQKEISSATVLGYIGSRRLAGQPLVGAGR